MICHSVIRPYRIVREACIELDSLQLVSCVQAQQCQTRRLALSEPVQQEPELVPLCHCTAAGPCLWPSLSGAAAPGSSSGASCVVVTPPTQL